VTGEAEARPKPNPDERNLFSLWLFPKSDVSVHKQPREKRVRNVVYVSLGVVMIQE
jgi:hypothetical protein